MRLVPVLTSGRELDQETPTRRRDVLTDAAVARPPARPPAVAAAWPSTDLLSPAPLERPDSRPDNCGVATSRVSIAASVSPYSDKWTPPLAISRIGRGSGKKSTAETREAMSSPPASTSGVDGERDIWSSGFGRPGSPGHRPPCRGAAPAGMRCSTRRFPTFQQNPVDPTAHDAGPSPPAKGSPVAESVPARSGHRPPAPGTSHRGGWPPTAEQFRRTRRRRRQ